MQQEITEQCQHCFGAEKLTADGITFIDCPICDGGKVTGKDLKIRNRKFLNTLTLDNSNGDNSQHESS